MLRTDYKNDILDTDVNVTRVYNIKNSSGAIIEENVMIEETTVFSQQGTKFGANDINATNEEVNHLTDSLSEIGNYTLLVKATQSQNNTIIALPENINNFRYIFWAINTDDNVFLMPNMMPVELFKLATTYAGSSFYKNGGYASSEITYVDDTHIKTFVSQYTYIRVYGIK